MTEVKHTEGPWEVDRVTHDIVASTKAHSLHPSEKGGWPDRATVAYACKDFFSSENIANAHLIAAAPEMEKALESLLGFVGLIMQDRSRMDDVLACQMAKAALAKAKGEEK